MESFEKKAWLNQLFDLYGDLLTEKQQSYFKLYYFEDYSLQEIAEVFEVSRNAVFDQLKKTEDYLVGYEHTLKCFEKREARAKLILEIEEKGLTELAEKMRKLDE
jgi:hypothetical protein